MNSNPKENNKKENQLYENIDEIIDEAEENAETRRDLSENELDGVAGGLTLTTDGGIMRD
jgi:hypothetical protein